MMHSAHTYEDISKVGALCLLSIVTFSVATPTLDKKKNNAEAGAISNAGAKSDASPTQKIVVMTGDNGSKNGKPDGNCCDELTKLMSSIPAGMGGGCPNNASPNITFNIKNSYTPVNGCSGKQNEGGSC